MSPPKTSRSRSSSPADKREAIMEGALACFVERGFHGTAVPQVARSAGIAAGTIYHYFPGKEALVNALYRHWKGEIARRVLTAFPATAPVREQFRVVFEQMVEFALDEPKAFAFIELHNHRSYLDDESLAAENRLKDFAATMVSAAQARGDLRPGPPTLLMELVFGAFIGMMRAHWEERVDITSGDARQLAEEACWRIVAPVD